MNKASKALRRSSVRLKSMSGGHRDLNMVISELRDARSSAKAFMLAQSTAAEDLLKWSMNNENQIIQDIFIQLVELNTLWTEVQKEFTEHLKEFIYQFEMILEGERHVDEKRSYMASCEQREVKIRQELKKSSKKSLREEEIKHLETKLSQAKHSRDSAEIEVVNSIQENEAVKFIRIKEGLLKLSESYMELAHKCHVIYETHRDIAHEIPDVHDKNIHEIQYTDRSAAKQAVARAKERLHRNRYLSHHLPCAPDLEDLPPPYSSHHPSNTFPRHHSTPRNSETFHLSQRSNVGPSCFNINVPDSIPINQTRSTTYDDVPHTGSPNSYHNSTSNESEDTWQTASQDDVIGAVGKLKL